MQCGMLPFVELALSIIFRKRQQPNVNYINISVKDGEDSHNVDVPRYVVEYVQYTLKNDLFQ